MIVIIMDLISYVGTAEACDAPRPRRSDFTLCFCVFLDVMLSDKCYVLTFTRLTGY